MREEVRLPEGASCYADGYKGHGWQSHSGQSILSSKPRGQEVSTPLEAGSFPLSHGHCRGPGARYSAGRSSHLALCRKSSCRYKPR